MEIILILFCLIHCLRCYGFRLLHGPPSDIVEDTQDIPAANDSTIDHAPATAKASQGRSRNFRDEDILLVSAWLNVGMDPYSRN